MFVLGRVSIKGLRTLPGADGAPASGVGALSLPPDSQFTGSNVFSVPEACLLAWASAHFAREFGGKVGSGLLVYCLASFCV